MLLGIVIVRVGILKPEDSRSLSVLSLYLILPCATLSSFCVDYTETVWKGLLLTVAASLAMHGIMIGLTEAGNRFYPLKGEEKASIIYSNAGGLVIPLVLGTLGEDWVIYATGFMTVQLVFVWSHGKMLICHKKKPDFLKMIKNPNMAATLIGIFMFLFRFRFPPVLGDAIASLKDMLAASGMLAAGMLIGNTDLRQMKKYKGIWITSLGRVIVCPVACLIFLKLSGMSSWIENGEQILLVTFLASATSTGLAITQMAQVYDQDAEYCSMINILTTILSVVTMPPMIMLYQFVMGSDF